MNKVNIVYNGPSGVYHCRDSEGTWHELVRGATFEVPEDLAKELAEVKGHEFEVADEKRTAPKPAPETPKPSPSGSTPPAPTVKGD